tara:strand:+ start:10663 stop:10992 length:330 start_codon:yes stop_codon:yes gene_type:complete
LASSPPKHALGPWHKPRRGATPRALANLARVPRKRLGVHATARGADDTDMARSAVMMKKLRRKSQLLLETCARSSRQRNTKKRLDAVGWFVPQRHSRRARRTRPVDTQC